MQTTIGKRLAKPLSPQQQLQPARKRVRLSPGFDRIPDEMLEHIFQYLPPVCLGMLRLVCHRWEICLGRFWRRGLVKPGALVQWAIKTNNLAVFTWFVRCPLHTYLRQRGIDILQKCARSGRAEMMRVLVDPKKTGPATPGLLQWKEKYVHRMLGAAARSGDLETLELVWEEGKPTAMNLAPIYDAYEGGSLTCIDFLKQQTLAQPLFTIDPTKCDPDLFHIDRALESAARGGHLHLIKPHLTLHPNKWSGTEERVFLAAMKYGQLPLCKWLWSHCGSLTGWIKTCRGLELVVESTNPDLVQWWVSVCEGRLGGRESLERVASSQKTLLANAAVRTRDFAMLDVLYRNGLFCLRLQFVCTAIQGDAQDVSLLDWLYARIPGSDCWRGASLPMVLKRAVLKNSVGALEWLEALPWFEGWVLDSQNFVHWALVHSLDGKTSQAVLDHLDRAKWCFFNPRFMVSINTKGAPATTIKPL